MYIVSMYVYKYICIYIPLHVIKIRFWPATDSTFKLPSFLHDGQRHRGFSGQNLSKESTQCYRTIITQLQIYACT